MPKISHAPTAVLNFSISHCHHLFCWVEPYDSLFFVHQGRVFILNIMNLIFKRNFSWVIFTTTNTADFNTSKQLFHELYVSDRSPIKLGNLFHSLHFSVLFVYTSHTFVCDCHCLTNKEKTPEVKSSMV